MSPKPEKIFTSLKMFADALGQLILFSTFAVSLKIFAVMNDFFTKLFDSVTYNQKALLVTGVIAFPLVYTCLFVCVDNFTCYNFVDRAIFTTAGVIIEMIASYAVYFIWRPVIGIDKIDFMENTPGKNIAISIFFCQYCIVFIGAFTICVITTRFGLAFFLDENRIHLIVKTPYLVSFFVVYFVFMTTAAWVFSRFSRIKSSGNERKRNNYSCSTKQQ